MHFSNLIAALSVLFAATSAHMQMSQPFPIRSSLDPNVDSSIKDYSGTAPLASDGSNFPCKGYQNDRPIKTTATYAAGNTYQMTFAGSASHGGGSCQISLSYDNGATFRVIKSIIGGCPLVSSYDFTVPSYAPNGTALLAWTWQNLVGNREYYMNGAWVDIVSPVTAPSKRSPKTQRRAFATFEQLPYVWKANLPGINSCVTVESQAPVYPDPGPDVEYGGGYSASSPVTPGTCDAPTPYGATYKPMDVVSGGMENSIYPNNNVPVSVGSVGTSSATVASVSSMVANMSTSSVASTTSSTMTSSSAVVLSSSSAVVPSSSSSVDVALSSSSAGVSPSTISRASTLVIVPFSSRYFNTSTITSTTTTTQPSPSITASNTSAAASSPTVSPPGASTNPGTEAAKSTLSTLITSVKPSPLSSDAFSAPSTHSTSNVAATSTSTTTRPPAQSAAKPAQSPIHTTSSMMSAPTASTPVPVPVPSSSATAPAPPIISQNSAGACSPSAAMGSFACLRDGNGWAMCNWGDWVDMGGVAAGTTCRGADGSAALVAL